jgi:hypothetical protein
VSEVLITNMLRQLKSMELTQGQADQISREAQLRVLSSTASWEKAKRNRIYRQLTAHMRTFGGKDVWGETFNPWQSANYRAEK